MSAKKLTVKDIIKRKDEILNKKNGKKEFYIESLDANIVCSIPSTDVVLEALDMEGREGDYYLIYNSIVEPNLKDAELQSNFELESPIYIVDRIFTPGEISSLGLELLKLAGYNDSVKLVDDIKN